jgi:chorismate synthase
MVNTFGRLLKLTTFGESHGIAVGGVLDGLPAGIRVDTDEICRQLDRRSPSAGKFTSGRKEPDLPEFLSGVEKGKTIGTPLAFIVYNSGQRSKDYDALKDVYRPSHADYSWEKKFGVASGAGGGRSSARSLLPVVIAGTIAGNLLPAKTCKVMAWVSSVGPVDLTIPNEKITAAAIEKSELRCPDAATTKLMLAHLEKIKRSGDTAGGAITCVINNCPAGLGEPVFGKLQADLAAVMLGINSVKGFEIGEGFHSGRLTGSQYNDIFEVKNDTVRTLTNHDGGINGGISNGGQILFRVAFKPVPSVHMPQQTIDRSLKAKTLKIEGRHDTVVLPRAVPIVEALAKLVLADHYLMQKTRAKL